MYVKIVLLSLLCVFLQHMVRVVWFMKYHVTTYNHTPGPCRLVPGVEFGSEDMETLPSGLTFITSGLIMPSMPEKVFKYYHDNNVQGRIFLFDFNHPENNVIDLPISEGFDRRAFAPHGISVFQDPETGQIILFVVSHNPGADKIEKFIYDEDDESLEHVRSYVDPAIHFINDVAATSENTFYFTQYAGFRDYFRHLLEVFTFMPFGSVMYFNGRSYETVTDGGMVLPNGITLSKDMKYAYLSLLESMQIYEREDNNTLTLIQELLMSAHPDNFLIEPRTGNLLTGAHPETHRISAHLQDPLESAPSKVLMINMKNGSHAESITELYSDDGHTLWGATVASVYNNNMLIGTVMQKLMFCEVRSITF